MQPGIEKRSIDDLIKNVEKGIYIVGDGSFSIDQQRYNFQFGGQLFYEIKNGKIVGMLRDVAYQSNTQEFWNSCVAIADESDYRLGVLSSMVKVSLLNQVRSHMAVQLPGSME